MSQGRVLIIAGSDSGGGAGLQADLKTVQALGGYGMTAITALTAQNTRGVAAVLPVPPDFLQAQIRSALDDIGADVLKIGMLGAAATMQAVAETLATVPDLPLVLDPVMVAKGGHRLLDPLAQDVLIGQLLPRATVLTPNLPEAEALTGRRLNCVDDMISAARQLQQSGAQAVLLKGGHLEGDALTDVLLTADGDILLFHGQRIHSRHTHGTGCTLASAIACSLAQGRSLSDAVARGRAYVQAAMLCAPGLGGGHGPLGHGLGLRFDPPLQPGVPVHVVE